jgi:ABC-type transporter Mla subunit MlaD
MQRPNQKKFRGISGVVIAVLLTVIGIAAVLMFWGMMSGFFNPQPKVIIEKATITKTWPKYI